MLKRDGDGRRVNASGRGLYSTHKYSSISFWNLIPPPALSGVWCRWEGRSPRSQPLLRLTIDPDARPIQRRMIDDSLGQSGSAGRGGQYGDRCRSMCAAFNNVKARHAETQGKWQQDQEGWSGGAAAGGVISLCNVRHDPADVVSCSRTSDR